MSSNGDVGTYYDIAGDGFRDKPMERMSSKQNSEIVESSQVYMKDSDLNMYLGLEARRNYHRKIDVLTKQIKK